MWTKYNTKIFGRNRLIFTSWIDLTTFPVFPICLKGRKWPYLVICVRAHVWKPYLCFWRSYRLHIGLKMTAICMFILAPITFLSSKTIPSQVILKNVNNLRMGLQGSRPNKNKSFLNDFKPHQASIRLPGSNNGVGKLFEIEYIRSKTQVPKTSPGVLLNPRVVAPGDVRTHFL